MAEAVGLCLHCVKIGRPGYNGYMRFRFWRSLERNRSQHV